MRPELRTMVLIELLSSDPCVWVVVSNNTRTRASDRERAKF